MKVLVTGTAGRLGSSVLDYLKSKGYETQGFDIRTRPDQDILNPAAVHTAMAGCEAVVHCAAIPHPNKGDMRRYFEINVTGSFNVMEAAAALDLKRFIYFSSIGYYGCNMAGKLTPAYLPIDENHPPAHMAPSLWDSPLPEYGESKVMAEQLLSYYASHGAFSDGAFALRLGPAGNKSKIYGRSDKWTRHPGYRFDTLYSTCDPGTIPPAVLLCLQVQGIGGYEPFILVDRYTYWEISLERLINTQYPDTVLLKSDWSDGESLYSPKKAMEILGWEPSEERGESFSYGLQDNPAAVYGKVRL